MKKKVTTSPGTPLTISGIFERSPLELKPFKGNARKHPLSQITKLAASIKEFGFTSTVLTDENGMILSGHARVEAATQLGLAWVPVRVIIGLTPAQKKAFVLADNKIALLASWDMEQLAIELNDLAEVDFPQELTGFTTAEIDLITDPEITQAQKADPAELVADDLMVPRTALPGDLFQMGKHRLYCGDARDLSAYERLMAGQKAQLVFTDPPYNVRVKGHVSGKGKTQHAEFAMASGEMNMQAFTQFLGEVFWLMAVHSQDGSVHYICMDWRHQRELLDAAQSTYGVPRQMVVWVKDNAGMGSFYRSQHELIYVFRKGDVPHINNFELGQHGRYRTNVWQYAGANSFKGNGQALLKLHPTVKPVALVADAIRDCSKRGGLTLDPFAGSGTLIIAAERTRRVAYCMELEPKFIDVAIARWQRVTGKAAIHVETGMDWETLGAKRRGAGLLGDQS